MNLSEREYYALLRNDLVLFVHRCFQTLCPGEKFMHNWHIEVIAYHLEQVRRGEIHRLIITLPPRSLKSILTSVALPAYLLGHDPTAQILCASYASPLSLKHARDCRTIMSSGWYQKVFRRTRLHPTKNTEAEFMTTQMGCRLATSVGGTLTGRGGNFIIVDDPLKADDAFSEVALQNCHEWFHNSLLSRLNNKKRDPIVVIQQRLHENDLPGELLEKGGWVHLNLPAIAEEPERIAIGPNRYHERKPGEALHPERESLEVLERLREELGSIPFAAQYQQSPVPIDGGMVHLKWFPRYKDKPVKENSDLIVQSWDTACKAEDYNDYSVCTTWLIHERRFYLLHVHRERLEYPALQKKISALAKLHHANRILIEDKAAGTSLIQDLRNSTDLNILRFEPKDDKQTRLMAVTALMESERIVLPEKAFWLEAFEHELLVFPRGRHDDQVDSVSQFLTWAKKKTYEPCDLLPMAIPSPFARTEEEMRYRMRHVDIYHRL